MALLLIGTLGSFLLLLVLILTIATNLFTAQRFLLLTLLLAAFLAIAYWGLTIIHNPNTVTQKYLTTTRYCNTLIASEGQAMANVLGMDKQVAVISALAEGSGIRQIERITGVHRSPKLAVRAAIIQEHRANAKKA